MRKFFLLIVIAMFALFGCSTKDDTNKDKEEVKDVAAGTDKNEDDGDAENDDAEDANNDTEKNAGDSADVVINMPADFFEEQSEDEVMEYFEEMGVNSNNVSVNADGSYTLKFTTEEHALMLKDMKDELDMAVEEIIGSMGVDSIIGAQMNDDVTELIINVDQDLYSGDFGGLILMDFSLFAMQYQVFNGITEENFDFAVVVLDETGEEINRTSVHDF